MVCACSLLVIADIIYMHECSFFGGDFTLFYAYFTRFVHNTALGDYLKPLNQTSSDSELTGHRVKRLSSSMGNLNTDFLKAGSFDRESVVSSTSGIFVPMQNMKHNVTEKVAQVSSMLNPMVSLSFWYSMSLIALHKLQVSSNAANKKQNWHIHVAASARCFVIMRPNPMKVAIGVNF